MKTLRRVHDFLPASLRGISGLGLPRSINHPLIPLLGFVALATIGCASTIATKYPHLDRRAVCVRVPGIEEDAAMTSSMCLGVCKRVR